MEQALGRARPRGSKVALFDSKSSQLGFNFADDFRVHGRVLFGSLGRPSSTLFATMVTTARTLELSLYELTLALLTFPSDTGPWLPPDTAGDFEILLIIAFHLGIAIGLDVAWVAMRPFSEFSWIPGTFGAAHVTALVTNGSVGRNEKGGALVARTTDSLLDGLIDSLVSGLGSDGQDFLLLGPLQTLIIAFLGLALVGRGLLLGVTWALLATLMLALEADLLGTERGSAVVALAMDAHTDGLLDALNHGGIGGSSKPLMRLEGQAIFGEEETGTLLLEGTAIDLVNSDSRWRGDASGGGDGGFGSGGLGGRVGGSRSRAGVVFGGGLHSWLGGCSGGSGSGSGRLGSGSGGGRFLALEDAAHSLDIFPQTPSPVDVSDIGWA